MIYNAAKWKDADTLVCIILYNLDDADRTALEAAHALLMSSSPRPRGIAFLHIAPNPCLHTTIDDVSPAGGAAGTRSLPAPVGCPWQH